MFCKECGSQLNPGAAFCPVCGTRIEATPAPTEPIAQKPIEKTNYFQSAGALDDSLSATPAVEPTPAPSANAETVSAVPETTQTPLTVPTMEPAATSSVETPFAVPSSESAPETFATTAFEPVSPGEPTPTKPKKKRSKARIAIITAIILVATACVVAASDYFTGWLGVFSPKKNNDFHGIVEDNLDSFSIDAAKALRAFGASDLDSSAYGEVKLTFGDSVKASILDSFEAEAGADATQLISWIDSIGLGGEFSKDDNAFGMNVSIMANDTSVVDMQAAIDYSNGACYYSFPTLSPKAIKLDMGYDFYEMQESMAATEQLQQIFSILPEEAELADMISRYASAIVDEIKNVKKSGETVEIGNVSQKNTCYTATLTEKDAMNMLKAVMEEARTDKTLEGIIKELENTLGMSGLYEQFIQGIDVSLEQFNSMNSQITSDEKIYVKVWVDSNKQITGIGFSVDGEDIEIKYQSAENGDESASCFSINADGFVAKLESEGKTQSGKYSGITKLNVAGTDYIEMECIDLDVKKYEKGLLEGTFSFSLSPTLVDMISDEMDSPVFDMLKNAKINIEFKDASEKSSTMVFSLMDGNEMLLALELRAEIGTGSGVTIPQDYISIDYASEEELAEWYQNADYIGIINNLESAGLPSEYAEALKLQIEQAINPSEDEMGEMPTEFEDFEDFEYLF